LRFYAPGKLLLSGEYAVLDGASAISCPTRKGQLLETFQAESKSLQWLAFDLEGKSWLRVEMNSKGDVISTSDKVKSEIIRKLLLDAFDQNIPTGLRVETHLEFKREWGLGSSSTLIALIAQWAKKDALNLFFKHLKGSGYDVATAVERRPISYQIIANHKATWADVQLPKILEKSYFVYLGKKQISSREVTRYASLKKNPALVKAISKLSRDLLRLSTDNQLIKWMEEHEEITSKLIQQEGVRPSRFPNLKGGFKSLGAWGGDFVWIMPKDDDLKYLHQLGYQEIIAFAEMLRIKP
jgi:mevalonate kinase